MTLAEMFEGMREEHRKATGLTYDWNLHGPKRAKRWYVSGDISIPEAAAESIICWAMVKALAEYTNGVVWLAEFDDSGGWKCNHSMSNLARAYFAAFPQEVK